MISTIGYEKADLEHFVGTLQLVGVEVLVDVRDRAQSRRKGFSKTALSERLQQAGIEYIHFRVLGDPKEGREAARSGNMKKFRSIFSQVLASEKAQQALKEVAKLSEKNHICLMCYERDHSHCHRKMVSDRLDKELGTKSRHLGVHSIEPVQKDDGPLLRDNQSVAA